MKTHYIKLNIEFCDYVFSGIKTFEIRYNDRGYQIGDHIKFIPYDSNIYPTIPEHPIVNKEYQIIYVINGWGLKNGYVAFGIIDVI